MWLLTNRSSPERIRPYRPARLRFLDAIQRGLHAAAKLFGRLFCRTGKGVHGQRFGRADMRDARAGGLRHETVQRIPPDRSSHRGADTSKYSINDIDEHQLLPVLGPRGAYARPPDKDLRNKPARTPMSRELGAIFMGRPRAGNIAPVAGPAKLARSLIYPETLGLEPTAGGAAIFVAGQ